MTSFWWIPARLPDSVMFHPALATLFVLALWTPSVCGRTAGPAANDSAKWEESIAKFEASPPPPGSILFTGSSSIRKWDLAAFWPGMPYVNRGFGGSRLPDQIYYFERVVAPCKPRAVVLYAGDNDFAHGAGAGEVVAAFAAFAAKLEKSLPGTPLLFISIKPSRKRWAMWPEMAGANRAIAALCEASPVWDFADIATPMLATAGQPGSPPDASLFEKDGLHMSAKGYELWKGVLQPWLSRFNP